MKFRWVPSVALALALASTACQQGARPLSDEDTTAIREALVQHTQGVLAGDLDVVAAGYTEDAIQMPPNAPIVQGRDNIRVWFEGFPAVTRYDIDVQAIEGSGDMAYVRGAYVLTTAAGADSEAMTDRGKNIAIFKRQSDGSWRVSVGIWNSDEPLPPMEGEHQEDGEHN